MSVGTLLSNEATTNSLGLAVLHEEGLSQLRGGGPSRVLLEAVASQPAPPASGRRAAGGWPCAGGAGGLPPQQRLNFSLGRLSRAVPVEGLASNRTGSPWDPPSKRSGAVIPRRRSPRPTGCAPPSPRQGAPASRGRAGRRRAGLPPSGVPGVAASDCVPPPWRPRLGVAARRGLGCRADPRAGRPLGRASAKSGESR